MRVGFREGAHTTLDVIDAETALARARANYIQAVHDYQVASVNLSWSMGVIGEEELPALPLEAALPVEQRDAPVSAPGGIDEQQSGVPEEAGP